MTAKMLLITFVLLLATAATAQVRFKTEVSQTLSREDDKFGGCMALLTEDINDATEGEVMDCPQWVTFDCVGEYLSKSAGLRMYDTAQIAQLADRRVEVVIDNTRKHNSYCLIEQIKLQGPTDQSDVDEAASYGSSDP